VATALAKTTGTDDAAEADFMLSFLPDKSDSNQRNHNYSCAFELITLTE
jgi:hypothetical protein